VSGENSRVFGESDSSNTWALHCDCGMNRNRAHHTESRRPRRRKLQTMAEPIESRGPVYRARSAKPQRLAGKAGKLATAHHHRPGAVIQLTRLRPPVPGTRTTGGPRKPPFPSHGVAATTARGRPAGIECPDAAGPRTGGGRRDSGRHRSSGS
jgi:hypothetical protein